MLNGFKIYLVHVKTMRTIVQIFVAFLEKLNFKDVNQFHYFRRVQKALIILESPVLYAQLEIKGSILDKALTKIQVDTESRNGILTSKIYPFLFKLNNCPKSYLYKVEKF